MLVLNAWYFTYVFSFLISAEGNLMHLHNVKLTNIKYKNWQSLEGCLKQNSWDIYTQQVHFVVAVIWTLKCTWAEQQDSVLLKAKDHICQNMHSFCQCTI